jgi:hypothetical protein
MTTSTTATTRTITTRANHYDNCSFENLNGNNSSNNQQALQETRKVQSKTLQALERIQWQAAETQAIGHATLQQLEQQDVDINRTMEATSQLNDNLKQASKLQDRFAVWSGQWGTKRMAKQLIKKERKFFGDIIPHKNNHKNKNHSTPTAATTTTTTPTFKRRGPRHPPKGNTDTTTTTTTTPSIDHVMETSIKESHDVTHQMDRAELFAGVKQHPPPALLQSKSNRRINHHHHHHHHDYYRGGKYSNQASTTLSEQEQEQAELAQIIHDDDQLVDEGLDSLANQMDQLHRLSITMGDTTRQQRNKLDILHQDMHRADDKSRKLNQRVKLFTLNKQEKTKERNKFETTTTSLSSQTTGRTSQTATTRW